MGKVKNLMKALCYLFEFANTLSYLGYKSRTFFLFNRNITALFYNVLSVGRENKLNQG